MNEYRIRSNGQVVDENQLRAMFPNRMLAAVLGPDDFNTLGFDPVLPSPPPTPGEFQSVIRATPSVVQDVLGNWVQAWQLENWSQGYIDFLISQMKVVKNLEINDTRLRFNRSYFPYAGKYIACDVLSRSDIDGVANHIALMGAFPAGFPNAWKATDNTYVSIPDIATFKDMYAAMTAQGSANFAHAQTLKVALAAATTPAQINAIVW